MAISAYMWFQDANGLFLDSESQVDFSNDAQNPALAFPPNNNIFEVENYSFDIAQVLNFGSQSSGVGAGKVTLTRSSSRARPIGLPQSCIRWLAPARCFNPWFLSFVNQQVGPNRSFRFRSSPSSWWASSPSPGPMTPEQPTDV